MAILSQTAASVARVTGILLTVNAGAAVTAGQPVYKKAADGLMYPATALTLAAADVVGIALNSAAIGQPVSYQISNTINVGASLQIGRAYYLSLTTGGICLEEDLGTGDFVTFLGFATTTSYLTLNIVAFNIAKV